MTVKKEYLLKPGDSPVLFCLCMLVLAWHILSLTHNLPSYLHITHPTANNTIFILQHASQHSRSIVHVINNCTHKSHYKTTKFQDVSLSLYFVFFGIGKSTIGIRIMHSMLGIGIESSVIGGITIGNSKTGNRVWQKHENA